MASWAHPSSCADIGVDTDDESVEPCEPHAALDLGDDASPRMYESADFGDLEQVGGRDPVPIFNASSQWRRQVTSAKLAEGGRRPERRGSDPFHFMGEDSDDGESESGGDPALQSTEAMMRLMMCVGGEEGKTYDEVVSHHYRPCELTPADALYDEIEELKKQVAALDEPRRRGDALPWQQGDDHCAVPGCTGASPDEGRRKRAPPHVCEDFEEDDFPEPPARAPAPAANRSGDRLFALSEVLELHVYAFLDGASLARFAGVFFRRYYGTDAGGLLAYLVAQLKSGTSLDLLVLKELLFRATKVDPKRTQYLFVHIAHAHLCQHQWQQALETIEHATSHPENRIAPMLHYTIGRLYDRVDQREVSEPALRQCLKLSPWYPESREVFFRLGCMYREMRKYERAFYCLNKAVTDGNGEGFFDLSVIWLELGTVARLLNKRAEAEAAFANSGLDPDVGASWHYAGNDYLGKLEYLKAFRCFRKAVALDPENHDLWASLIDLYRTMGQNEEAL